MTSAKREGGREGGREGAPLPACLVVARYFLLTFGFLTRVLASATKIPEEEGTKWDRFSLVDPIGNKSQSPLPLLFYSSAINRPIETSNSMLFVLPIPDLSLPLSPSNKCRSSLPPLTARRISVCSGREEEHLTYVTSVKWRNQSTPAECGAGKAEELCTRASFQKHLCTLDQLSVVSLGMFMFGSYGTDRKCCLFFSYTITRFLPSSVPSSLTSSCLFPATRAS